MLCQPHAAERAPSGEFFGNQYELPAQGVRLRGVERIEHSRTHASPVGRVRRLRPRESSIGQGRPDTPGVLRVAPLPADRASPCSSPLTRSGSPTEPWRWPDRSSATRGRQPRTGASARCGACQPRCLQQVVVQGSRHRLQGAHQGTSEILFRAARCGRVSHRAGHGTALLGPILVRLSNAGRTPTPERPRLYPDGTLAAGFRADQTPPTDGLGGTDRQPSAAITVFPAQVAPGALSFRPY